jgi:N-acetyl-1-D-myo-inositol-2-amino-2-deoxy-alpha-D-glucopyranoside deacetylase
VAASRRLLLVHAHPDDETIGSGATMARYAASGAAVTLVTCTRGERGEVIPPPLAALAGDGPALGAHREGELAGALAALGVADQRFLGAPSRVYRDSGMAYAPDGSVAPAPDPGADAFALAELDAAARELVAVLVEVRPQVVVTYEPGGGYGHPDHVQAHHVTMRSVALAADEGWRVPKVYWIVRPESVARAEWSRWPDVRREPVPSMVVPDAEVTARVDGSAFVGAKIAAMRAHATQIEVAGDATSFRLSNHVPHVLSGVEYYRLALGEPGGERDAEGRETDLFGGLGAVS